MHISGLKRKFKLMDFSSSICMFDYNKFNNIAFDDGIYRV
jgi:hypothetical protein